MEPRRET